MMSSNLLNVQHLIRIRNRIYTIPIGVRSIYLSTYLSMDGCYYAIIKTGDMFTKLSVTNVIEREIADEEEPEE